MAYWERYFYETSVKERDYGHLVGISLKQGDVRQAVFMTRVCAEQLHEKLGAVLKNKPGGI